MQKERTRAHRAKPLEAKKVKFARVYIAHREVPRYDKRQATSKKRAKGSKARRLDPLLIFRFVARLENLYCGGVCRVCSTRIPV